LRLWRSSAFRMLRITVSYEAHVRRVGALLKLTWQESETVWTGLQQPLLTAGNLRHPNAVEAEHQTSKLMAMVTCCAGVGHF